MNSSWYKRTWTILFGALAVPTVLLPSVHNFRIVSILGILTTTITSLYMTLAAIKHGQVKTENVFDIQQFMLTKVTVKVKRNVLLNKIVIIPFVD